MKTVIDFILGLQNHCIDCSHGIKRCLLLGRRAMTNLDSILKSRDITLPSQVLIVKAMAFPVVMYGCECSTIKKAEWQRIDAFTLWCWRRLLRVPWTARRSNQSILAFHGIAILSLSIAMEYLSMYSGSFSATDVTRMQDWHTGNSTPWLKRS